MYWGIYLSYVFIAYPDVLSNDFLSSNEVVVFNFFFFVDVDFNFSIAVARSEKYT